ncbi:MAG: ADP-ribosylglycohydrolase family protein [Oscillochloridaceae bacterium]|nr:ADP-ribosylglycohydrolase family protein [Chloroflexaceae bacterium]MDW8389297.1 ADP-ribosylglycohydrolase family protein [Oscillochloridaceae bacterium]
MALAHDYLERVYAGVLGKCIGVYLGRPVEQWTHERISAEVGEIGGYVHARFGLPLVVTDDDITGTFTFLRALPDHGNDPALTPAQIGAAWLNYLIEGRTGIWWGGLGVSTEHTAYLRLKSGIPAPASGSAALNGRIVAEQIGGRIFADGWAMVAPGDPDLAADLAGRAASVSHDGEAVHAARALAAMEALAFVEGSIPQLLDAAIARIPADCATARLIIELRALRAREADWRAARRLIAERYAYDRYRGGCHVVPNQALLLLGLLWGDGDFGRSLGIVVSAGLDTDCNAGNLGCLLGIRGGLAALDAGPYDWRSPIADRLFLPGADGGRAISDALTEAVRVANIGRALHGLPPLAPKGGAQFHFTLPGSVQGFRGAGAEVRNLVGPEGARQLAVSATLPAGGTARAATPVFILPEELAMPGYPLVASPRLYPGQEVYARLIADATNAGPVVTRLSARVYGPQDALEALSGPPVSLAPGAEVELHWRVPDTAGAPLADIGVEVQATVSGPAGLRLDRLGWRGAPEVTFTRPPFAGSAWRRAWVNAVDQWDDERPEAFWLTQNAGRGLLIQGAEEWRDYEVQAVITPSLCAAAGIAARVGGLRRFYALLLRAGGRIALLRALDADTLLAEAPFVWQQHRSYALRLAVEGPWLRAFVDDAPIFAMRDPGAPLRGGAAALVVEEGHMHCAAVRVEAGGA